MAVEVFKPIISNPNTNELSLDCPEISEDPRAFFDEIHRLDQAVYQGEDVGETQPMIDRYVRNKGSYIYLKDSERPGEIVGYLNFLSCSDSLRELIMNKNTPYPRLDDEIGIVDPGDIEDYSVGKDAFIYILSIVIKPEYQNDKSYITALTDGFCSFLRELNEALCDGNEEGTDLRIRGLAGCAVSAGGRKVLTSLRLNIHHEMMEADGSEAANTEADGSRFVKTMMTIYDEPGEDTHFVRRLIEDGVYVKTWKDDVYLMLPLTEHERNRSTGILFDNEEDFDPYEHLTGAKKLAGITISGGEGIYDADIPEKLKEYLGEYIQYECTNQAVRDIEMFYLGCFDFLHTNDNYNQDHPGYDAIHDRMDADTMEASSDETECMEENIADKIFSYSDEETEVGLQKGYVILSAHRSTHMYIATVFFPEYAYSTTQLEDQVSNDYLKIADPRISEDIYKKAGKRRYLRLYDYLWETYRLHRCGQEKILLCMDKKPDADRYPTEFQNILAAEVYNSTFINYHIDNESLRDMCLNDRAQYSYYEAYTSQMVIAFILEKKYFELGLDERMNITATYLFIAELIMFQNTALARMNAKVTEALASNGDMSTEEILELNQEYARTIPFWEPRNFNYLGTQAEADQIKKAFSNEELRDTYNQYQEFLEHVVDLKNGERENRNSMILNIAATVLAIIQVQGFATDLLAEFYASAGIEIASRFRGFDTTFSHSLLGMLFVLILFIFIRDRKKNRDKGRKRR